MEDGKAMASEHGDRSARLRAFFARYVAARGGAGARVAEAFAAVPREPFAGPGPWSIKVPGREDYLATPDDDPAYLYQDTLVAIVVGRGINFGEPSLHARCLEAVAPRAGEAVLHVGAGVGYYTALLAHLVGPGGRVHAVEVEPDLAARAAANLAGVPQAAVQCRSGLDADLPEADVVYVNAGLPTVPPAWLAALRPGGRLIFPFQPVGGFGAMLRVERPGARETRRLAADIRVPSGDRSWPARFVTPAGFIGCRGGQDDEAGRRLAAAMSGGDGKAVRSLRRDDTPDATCWLRGDGWWLSTAEPGAP